MSEAWDEKAVFLSALELAPADRSAFLEGACPDPAARARIDSLFEHHGKQDFDDFGAHFAPQPGLPEQIGEFQILSRLGEGGMGVVYLARDSILDRKVAIKVLSARLTASESALSRFRDEARSAAALRHPAIVPVFRFGFDGGHHYLVSEYVEGETLAQHLERERTRRGQEATGARAQAYREWYRSAAEIVASIAEGLEHSHTTGIIHRDVKPSNILIDQQHGSRLTDFGIAKQISGDTAPDATMVEATSIIGSCHTMSPEQAGGNERIDRRSDVFSLGAVMYECLCLKRPFDGEHPLKILEAVRSAEPVSLRRIDPHIPKDLETICHKALRKDPRERYQTAAHMGADLRCYLRGDPILATPPSLARRGAHWLRVHPVRATVVAVAMLVLMSLVASALYFQGVIHRGEMARQAWIRVEGPPGCTAYLTPFEGLDVRAGAPASIGSLPVEHRVPLGQYRLTVAGGPDGEISEFNLLLNEAGEERRQVIRAFKAQAQLKDTWSPDRLDGALEFDRKGMLLIEEGYYNLTGVPHVDPPVHVRAFLIDEAPVSNQEYQQFTEATGYPKPQSWGIVPFEDIADRPVIWVGLEGAEAYARWVGKRLPTFIELQAASRGLAGDPYPTGAEPPQIQFQRQPPPQGRTEEFMRDFITWSAPTTKRMPWEPIGRPCQTLGSVWNLTGSLDPLGNVMMSGRDWTLDPTAFNLEGHATGPIRHIGNPRCGFRCAKSINPLPKEPP